MLCSVLAVVMIMPATSSAGLSAVPAPEPDTVPTVTSSPSLAPRIVAPAVNRGQGVPRDFGLGQRLPPPEDTGTLSSVPIPRILAQAYAHAVGLAPAGCHLDVTLLAAIGQVESGSLLGFGITTDNRVQPAIYGPVLNGGRFAAISDSDLGKLDGDAVWDRAVGPMQFIPGTWRYFGVDGDGDGAADPQNVFDAAASAAKYLCWGGRDLANPTDLRAAILSYNYSTDYLNLVLRWQRAFATGMALADIAAVAAKPSSTPAPTSANPPKATAAPTQPVSTHPVPATSSPDPTGDATSPSPSNRDPASSSTSASSSASVTPSASGTPSGSTTPSGCTTPSISTTPSPSTSISESPTPTPTPCPVD